MNISHLIRRLRRLRRSVRGLALVIALLGSLSGLAALLFLRVSLPVAADPLLAIRSMVLLLTVSGFLLFGGLALTVALVSGALARIAQDLAALADVDALTGARTRHGLDSELRAAAEAQERRGHPYALLVADLDHFKVVNDTWGHAVGDEVLRSVAHLFQAQLRPDDTLFRIGGEEFLVVARDTEPEGAMALAERLRLAVAENRFGMLPEGRRLTVSIGVATTPPGDDPKALLTAADAAMYAAKQAGRNRTLAAPATVHLGG